jgi:hypothetical protein
MSSQPILGVDPGAHGAIAVLTGHGEIVQIWDMPTLEDGPAGRRNVNAALLAEIAYRGDRLTLATHYIRAADAIRGVFECRICGHNGDRPRGHSSLIGALDVQIAVNCDAAENIIAELELSKDGPIGLQFVSRLVPVQIGVDQDGDTVTSCVVEKIKGAVVSARKSRDTRASEVRSNRIAGVAEGYRGTRRASHAVKHNPGVRARRECRYVANLRLPGRHF